MENTPPIYTLKNAKLSFGLKPLFEQLDLTITKGDTFCLIGRNGSGKSTLLKLIAGLLEPDSGTIFTQPGIKITYMAQESDLSGFSTLRDYILSGIKGDLESLSYKADMLISALKINEMQHPDKASGGEAKKAALAHALIQEPDILLLDEPTNHLDIASIESLQDIIKSFTGALIIISHDRAFLSAISNATLWLDRGTLRQNNKGYAYFEQWQDLIIEQEIIAQKHLAKRLDTEEQWLHQGVKARRKRNMGRLRRLQDLRQERREQIKQVGSVSLNIDAGDIQSKMISTAKHITKSYGDKIIINDFSIRILRGNKIGIVGPNGVGKTTLIKLLTQKIPPDSGFVRIAKNLQEAYFDQNRLTLDTTKTLWKTLCPEGDTILAQGKYRHVVSYLKDFLFTPEQAKSPVGTLSGGEKNRLMLALILAQPSNLLVLDEPTNDLDMDTLDLLQEVLSLYTGTILIISHDRDFLDKTTSSLLYIKGDGSVVEYVGTYSDLLAENRQKSIIKKPPIKQKSAPIMEKTTPKSQNKITFTQKHTLKNLPAQIKELEEKIAHSSTELNNPDFYTQAPTIIQEKTTHLHQLKCLLEEKENLWLELSLLDE